MKYFLHNGPPADAQYLLRAGKNNSARRGFVAGPFSTPDSGHQWRRLKVVFETPPPRGTSIEVATLAHEAIAELPRSPEWFPRRTAGARSEQQRDDSRDQTLSQILHASDGVFGALDAEAANQRTPLLDPSLARGFASLLRLLGSPEPLPNWSDILRCMRSYPFNATDVALWHQAGDRRNQGTQLWVFLRFRSGNASDSVAYDAENVAIPPVVRLELESQEHGWERDLPAIYSQTPDPNSEVNPGGEQSRESVLLAALLHLFEANVDEQREEIRKIADWHVPTCATSDVRELARHLGVSDEGLEKEQLVKLLPKAFQTYVQRGKPDTFVDALRLIYDDLETKDKILRIREPITTCRPFLLGDKESRLGDPEALLCAYEANPLAVKYNVPPLRPAGLGRLAGRAILHVSAAAFPEGTTARDELEALAVSLAPAHLRIVIHYVGDTAVLGYGAAVGECVAG